MTSNEIVDANACFNELLNSEIDSAPVLKDLPTRDWLFKKSNGCIINVNLKLQDEFENVRNFICECHTVSYGKYIAWYCQIDAQHTTDYKHPFRYIDEKGLEKNERDCCVVCGYVYDNEITRQILRHLSMTDAELRNHIASYLPSTEYRAELIKCLSNLQD